MSSENKFIKGVYINREYSWLMFNNRVLDQANDPTNPLLERCKFLSIFHSNFDEFFMVRVGSLIHDAFLNADAKENKTDLTAAEQVEGILKQAKVCYKAADSVYTKLKSELNRNGLKIRTGSELTKKQYAKCKQYFVHSVLPLLSPMVLDAKHPMIKFENMFSYMMFELTKSDRLMYGVMAISQKLPAVYKIGGGKKVNIITTEELIRTFGHLAFEGYKIKSQAMLRLTRNADFDANIDDRDIERDFDFSKFLKHKVELRGTLEPVRLQIEAGADNIKAFVLKLLGLKKAHCFTVKHFDFKFLMSLGDYFEPERLPALKYKPARPLMPPVPPESSVLETVLNRDVFLAYPYDSMDTLVRLLFECAADPRVASIKITIYRLDHRSRIVEALKKASESGKDVTVVIELCARFDEENNLYFSEVLKEAGCTVIFGCGNYKVHSKIISVVLSDGERLRYITHLGTGNYNEQTSKLYTDLNIITSDESIGEDAVAFFRNLSICNIENGDYKKLLIAPKSLKSGIIHYIERETDKAKNGKPAYIYAKMNSLTDKVIIDKLIVASKAGVQIKLVIRGICCLVPGVQGKTENISVISIVGRLLEHSRIYCFGDQSDRALFISSADLMTRNTDKRVEIATPVTGELSEKIFGMLNVMLADNVKAKRLLPDGVYESIQALGEDINSQERFLKGQFSL